MFAVDRAWRIAFVNAAAERLAGRTRAELLGEELWALFPEALGTEFEAVYRQAMDERVPAHVQAFYAPSGRWLEAHAYPVEWGLAVRYRNMSERKREEAALQESEERYRRMFEGSPFAKFLVDPGTDGFLEVNAAALARYGYTREEFLSMTIRDLRPAEDLPALEAALTRIRTGMLYRGRFRQSTKSGELLEVEVTTQEVPFSGRSVRLVTVLDVTEQVETEWERAELLERERAARAEAEARAREATDLSVLLQQQVEESRALGEQLGAVNEALQAANDQLVSLSVAADTARERAERAVKERDEVIAVVSHDLKNPLHTISITLAVLRNLPLSEAQGREKLGIIDRTVERMNRLIGGLLDMRRIEAREALSVAPRPTRADTLIRDGCDLFRPQAEEKRIRLVGEIPEDSPAVLADPERVLQVFWNLIGNAIKFTPEGGMVRIGCETRGEAVRFSVSDSGPGIPAEYLDRLFDPFWQEKRTARMGTGLGLPIARGIVEAHGGTIEVESRVGEGATFSFTLPAQEWSEGDPDRRNREDRRSGEDRRQ